MLISIGRRLLDDKHVLNRTDVKRCYVVKFMIDGTMLTRLTNYESIFVGHEFVKSTQPQSPANTIFIESEF
jgi:hypothetical protein